MPSKRTCRLSAAFGVALSLFGCAAQTEFADSETNRHIVAAESALARADYLEASVAYRLAAETTDRLETVRYAAETSFEFGRDEDAAAAIGRWAELAPDDPEVAVYQARLALRLDDAAGALRHFDRLVAISEDSDQALDRISQFLLVDGRADTAFSVAQSLSERHPERWHAQRALSRVALRADEKDRSMEAAERAYELAADSYQAGLLQAQSIIIGGDRSAGLEFAAEIAGDAKDSDDTLEYAGLLAAANELEEAMAVVGDIRRAEPGNLKALKAAALLNVRAGEFDEAWRELTELAMHDEHQHEAMFYLAAVAERQQRNNQAMRIYAQIGDGIHTVTAQQRVSEILIRTGRTDAAIEHLEDFTARQPEYGFRLLLPRAGLLRELERYDEAIALYDKVLELRPRAESVLLTRAETLLLDDRLDDAVAAYRQSVSIHPESAASLNALGYTLADNTTEYAEARGLIEKALALDPENPAIIDSMGWIQFKQGEYAQALVHLERAWELIKDPEVAAHLGETLWKLGEKEKAKAILKEAYDRSPNSKPLRETLQRLLEAESGITS